MMPLLSPKVVLPAFSSGFFSGITIPVATVNCVASVSNIWDTLLKRLKASSEIILVSLTSYSPLCRDRREFECQSQWTVIKNLSYDKVVAQTKRIVIDRGSHTQTERSPYFIEVKSFTMIIVVGSYTCQIVLYHLSIISSSVFLPSSPYRC